MRLVRGQAQVFKFRVLVEESGADSAGSLATKRSSSARTAAPKLENLSLTPLRLVLSIVMVGGCGPLGSSLVGGEAGGAGAGAGGAGGSAGAGTAGAGAAAGPGCSDDLEYFRTRVWEPILAPDCVVCHSAGGLAQRSRLVLDRAASALVANLDVVRRVAREEADGTSILLLRPSGRHPSGHPGGTLVQLGDDRYRALEGMVARAKGQCTTAPPPSASCATPELAKRRLRRLTRGEYDRTIADLFGVTTHPGDRLAADTVVGGFSNRADSLVVAPLLADQLRTSAEEIAAAAAMRPELQCADAACLRRVTETLGRRVFRRPLAPAEVDRYARFGAQVLTDEGAGAASAAVIAAILQSPHFLYRSELGKPAADGSYVLDGFELATALSYLLWGTTPDDALLDDAAAGRLDTPAGIATIAARMAADARSGAAWEAFSTEWLSLDQIATVPRDQAAFPELSAAVRRSMAEEARRFVAAVRAADGTLGDLLTSRTTFVDGTLAAFYGWPAAGAGWAEVTRPAGQGAGLLALGGVLLRHALPQSSSPIHRGKLVRERLLCQDLPPPPPALGVMPPPVVPGQSTRDRYAAHSTVEPCRSCHRLMDPIGFALEAFDGVGRFRTSDAGRPVDTRGEILETASSDGAVEGAESLAQKLAGSADVAQCFARLWVRWGFGADERGELPCLTEQVAHAFSGGERRLGEVVLAIVTSDAFRRRRADDAVTPPPTGGMAGSSGTAGSGGTAGGGAAGSGGAAGGGAPPMPGGVAFDVATDSDWGAGYCKSVTVRNTGAAPVEWTVTLPVEGTRTDLWNAVATAAGADTRFAGVEHNRRLDPTASTRFGFCATR